MSDAIYQTVEEHYRNTASLWQSLEGEIQQRYLNSLLPLLKSISQQVPAGSAVDVGCGGGRYTQFLPPFFKKVIGVDLTRRLVEAGGRAFPEIEFLCADATDLPIPDSSAGFVMSVGLTECLNGIQIEKYCAEMSRVLVPGGMCLFRVWGRFSASCRLARHNHGVAAAYPEFYFYGRREIRNLLQSQGLEDVRFVGALLLARWWGAERKLGRLLWSRPVRRLALCIERHARRLPGYDTYWAIARKTDGPAPVHAQSA